MQNNKIVLLLKQIRVHQWVKNILVFVPIVASHQVMQVGLLEKAFYAFISFSFMASAIYVFNDIVDLSADRIHPSKKSRPLASGKLSVGSVTGVGVAIAVAGLWLAYNSSLDLFKLLFIYAALNLSYSFYLKKQPILDVMLLSSFYALRILAGGYATDIPPSPWLLAFSMFIFTSLALVKRVSELKALTQSQVERASKKDYRVDDLQILNIFGVTTGSLAILVLALYVNNPDVHSLYPSPNWLWLLCACLFYWLARTWLKANRGEIKDDPVVAAIRDPGSYLVFLAAAFIIYLAS